MSEILINIRPGQTRVAYIEDNSLVDFKVERKTAPTLVGSIYKGKVIRVLPGMQAAFVDIGLDRAAFLYVGDIRVSEEPETCVFLEEDEQSEKTLQGVGALDNEESNKAQIQDLIKEGEMLLIQVAKDPLGTKGARITTHISLPGRNLVFMPTLSHFGVSRKIEQEEEKERLKKIFEELQPKGGVIVRTAGEGAVKENFQSDLDYLYRLWSEIKKTFNKKKTAGIVHSEVEIEQRAVRDMLNENVDKIIIDDKEAYKKLQNFVSQFMPSYKKLIQYYDKNTPLFDEHNIDIELSRSIGRKVWLKSGGYLVIDEAEALVVIDINTGSYVGHKDLEDTIFKTNLEAVKEIAHQLRIRNCGGIIIIDFIDMEKETHKEKVLKSLEFELGKDRARTTITGMSELGLVEMTRKRTRPSLISLLCEPCSYCEGKGYIKQKMTVSNEIFRALERERHNENKPKNVVVHCHSEVANWIYEEETEALAFIEEKMFLNVAVKINPNFHMEQFETVFI